MDLSQSRTLRYVVGGLAGLALLILLGWLVLRESPPTPDQSVKIASAPPHIPPPAPLSPPDKEIPHDSATSKVAESTTTNAAVLYQQAFALYDALTKEEKGLITRGTNDPSATAGLCGKIQPICDLMRQAAAVSNCDWGVEQPIIFKTLFPYLQGSRNLARAATWSVAHCRTNDPSAAVGDLIATSRLGQNAASPATVIGLLVDLAIQRLAADSIADNASLLASTDDSQLIDLLTNTHYGDELRRAFEQSADISARVADDVSTMPPDEALRELTDGMAESGYASFASQIQSMGQAQAVADIRQAVELEREYAQVLVMPDPEYSAWIASRDEDETANPFIGFLVTPLEQAVDKTQHATVISAMAAAGLAVMQDGPDALASYPDPATGQPFTYTQTDDGFVLKSEFQFQGKTAKLSFK
jgi:hypothetical protein